jgi:group I intron endonuclease
MKSGIYKILNTTNGKFYIGSAIDLKGRWRVHKFYLKNNNDKRVSKYLLNAWNKYGAENFEFLVLEHCEKEKLIVREQFYLDTLKPQYNISRTAGSPLGVKHSDDFKEQARARQLGRVHTKEHNQKISESNKKPKSKEHAMNIRLGKTGKKHTSEHRSINSFSHRDFDKWPHPEGKACKCDDCKQKKKDYHRNWRLAKAQALETSEGL